MSGSIIDSSDVRTVENYKGKSGPILVSIVICTYNRCDILPHCLNSLRKNTLINSCEVIVVDNHSTDRTRDLIQEFVEANLFANLRYVYEPKVGLSYARNRGWQEAAGDYIGYLDDDGKPDMSWLAVAWEIINTTSYGIFGGPYVPFYLSEVPVWWRDVYRSGGHGDKAVELADWQFLSGGNFFIRKDLLAELGGFSVEYGMCGSKIGLGEETLLQLELRRKFPGEPIYYEPRLVIEHLVSLNKMTLRWLVPFWFAEGRSETRLMGSPQVDRRRRFIIYRLFSVLMQALFWGLTSLAWRDFRRYPFWHNYIVEEWSELIRVLGKDYQAWLAWPKSCE